MVGDRSFLEIPLTIRPTEEKNSFLKRPAGVGQVALRTLMQSEGSASLADEEIARQIEEGRLL